AMSSLTFRGAVTLAVEGYPLAGVTVLATLVEDDATLASSTHQKSPLQLGRAESNRDGQFSFQTDANDVKVARWACALQNCDGFHFRLTLLDRDGTVLHSGEPLAWHADANLALTLRAPRHEPTRADWDEAGSRLYDAQAVRLDQAARELTSLAPHGL